MIDLSGRGVLDSKIKNYFCKLFRQSKDGPEESFLMSLEGLKEETCPSSQSERIRGTFEPLTDWRKLSKKECI